MLNCLWRCGHDRLVHPVLASHSGEDVLALASLYVHRLLQSYLLTDLVGTAFISIFSAVMICMVGVGISKPGVNNTAAVVDTDLYHGFTAVTNIVFAFCTISTSSIQEKEES